MKLHARPIFKIFYILLNHQAINETSIYWKYHINQAKTMVKFKATPSDCCKSHQTTRPTMTIRIRVNLVTMMPVALLGVKLLQLSIWQQAPAQAFNFACFVRSLHAFLTSGQYFWPPKTADPSQSLIIATVPELPVKVAVRQYLVSLAHILVLFTSHFWSAFGDFEL